MAFNMRRLLGAPRSTASTEDSVLIIIDAQNEYINGHLAVKHGDASRKVIATLLEKYRESGGDVVHVLHQVPDGAPIFTPGTSLAEPFDELTPKAGEKIVRKKHPSAFAETDLQVHLLATKKSKIVLTGYMAHVCVSTSARAGSELGWDVLVVEDAIGDRDLEGVSAEEVVKVVIAELEDAFATVGKASELVL